ncbi:MAG: sensor histidine kinase [Ekhidna sp.]
MKKIKLKEGIVHLLIVSVCLALLNYAEFDLTIGVFRSGDQSFLLPSILGTIINMVLFYGVSLYLIPITLRKNGLALFVIWLLVWFIVLSGVEFCIDLLIFLLAGREYTETVQYEMIMLIVLVHVLTVIIGVAYRFSKDWFANEEIRRSVSEQQLRSELEVLKSQINPHFLFNALNNLFSMALHSGDEKTAEGISKLSEMMRYVFDRSSQDKVALAEEIQYIQDYLHLQQLRFEKQVDVAFQYEESETPFSIAPMLLIPFVENAFKYGVSSQEHTTIEIRMHVKEDTFRFEIANKVVDNTETIPSSGVGIVNVRKRLALIYPEKHILDVENENGMFKVFLSITK